MLDSIQVLINYLLVYTITQVQYSNCDFLMKFYKLVLKEYILLIKE